MVFVLHELDLVEVDLNLNDEGIVDREAWVRGQRGLSNTNGSGQIRTTTE